MSPIFESLDKLPVCVGLRQPLHWDCSRGGGGGGDWPVHLLPGEQVQQDHGELCQDDSASGPGEDFLLQFVLLTDVAQVVREGTQKEIEASELVVGDIVQIRGGATRRLLTFECWNAIPSR